MRESFIRKVETLMGISLILVNSMNATISSPRTHLYDENDQQPS